MDDKEKKVPKVEEEQVTVPMKMLTDIQETIARLEKESADKDGKLAGLEELFTNKNDPESESEQKKLRGKKTYEPKFRLVRIRKYPIAGDIENMGYVIGWTNRGAYQKVNREGVSPVIQDYLDIIFLNHERNAEGKLQAESVQLLDLMNRGEQIFCKILDVKKVERTEPTGEEINVLTWDPQHGPVQTGETIDGFVTYSDIEYKVLVPGTEGIWIDAKFLN